MKAGTEKGNAAQAAELGQLPSFDSGLGTPLRVVHLYTRWKTPAPIGDLTNIASTGAYPLIDWGCQDSDANVAAGKDDQLIANYAKALKSYGRPVFLRWFWEMNVTGTNPHSASSERQNVCISDGGPAGYIAAWQHIWTIFHNAGANNVAFVWSPGIGGSSDPALFYPGNQYVDWIGADGYDRKQTGASAFSTIFSSFYQRYSTYGKPIMIAETGALAADQSAFLQGILATAPTMPDIKAVVYFDAAGPKGSWVLTGPGLQEFALLADNVYFKQAG